MTGYLVCAYTTGVIILIVVNIVIDLGIIINNIIFITVLLFIH